MPYTFHCFQTWHETISAANKRQKIAVYLFQHVSLFNFQINLNAVFLKSRSYFKLLISLDVDIIHFSGSRKTPAAMYSSFKTEV